MKKLFIASILASSSLMLTACTPKETSADASAMPATMVATVTGAAVAAPPASKIAVSGTSVIAADWRDAIVSRWKAPANLGCVAASDQGLKLITSEQSEHIYSLQTQLLNQIPLAKGDTLLVRFAARSLQAAKISGVTKLQVGFGKASPDWSSSLKSEIGLSSSWERYDFPFTCKDDFAPGEAQMVFQFGFPAQQAEIADLQVLRFGPEVQPESLPKTKRAADKFPPTVVQAELDRVAKMKAELDAVKNPAPANGHILYVAKTGSATNDGSKAQPFATIPQALAVVKPGDTIQVGAGQYLEPKGISIKTSGRPDAWIHLQAAPGARPKLITSSWSGIDVRSGTAYIEIKGFELEWVPDAAINAASTNTIHGSGIALSYGTHHVRVLDNVVHGYGTSGIGTLDCDYVTIEGNTVYDCAKTSPYGGSAMGLCRGFNFDEYPGYHNVFRGNICYDNELKVSTQTASGGNDKALTDGNGIIIDSLQQSRANPLKPHYEDRDGPLLPYRQRTLIENNLIYNNGGRGIHVFRSDKVDVINNTCYLNQKTPDISAGEITFIQSIGGVIANNICYARKEKRANTSDGSSQVIWKNNLFYGSDDVLTHDGLIQADPQFIAPALDAKPEGFQLKPESPALGKGVVAIAPTFDLAGKRRPANGPIDLGAFQWSK